MKIDLYVCAAIALIVFAAMVSAILAIALLEIISSIILKVAKWITE